MSAPSFRFGAESWRTCWRSCLPVVTAIALIPVRVDHARVALLVLVLPVVLVALLGTTGPAIVAAACAVLAFDFFLAEPYYSFAIEDADEIVAAATLFVVALVVGVLNARLVRARIRDSARRDELRNLIAFARTVADVRDEARLDGGRVRAHRLGTPSRTV